MAIAAGSISIIDLQDALVSDTPPKDPTEGCLWIDTSGEIDILKSYINGVWVEQNLSVEILDPGYTQTLNDFMQHAASDGIITQNEKLNIKLLLVQLTGDTLTEDTLPTINEIKAIKGGQVYTALAEAEAAGVPTILEDGEYQAFQNAYLDLKAYLEGLSPRVWQTGDTTIDTTQWPLYWDAYYEKLSALQVVTSNYLADALKPGETYNNLTIDKINGIKIVRGDAIYQVLLNATKGLSIEKKNEADGSYSPTFYTHSDGKIYATGLVISSDSTLGGTTVDSVIGTVAAGEGAINANPSFYDWPGTYPVGYSSFVGGTGSSFTKTVSSNGKGNAVKFTVGASANAYLNPAAISNLPYYQYVTLELTFKLESGTLTGSGILFRYEATTDVDFKIKLNDLVSSPLLSKWYTVTKTIKHTTSTAPTGFTGYSVFPMGGWTSFGTVDAKTIYFDKVKARPSTEQEIQAYEAKILVDDMVSDSRIAPNEKVELNRTWEAIKAEYTQLSAQAVTYNLTATNYTTAYTNLDGVTPKIASEILADMTTTYTFADTTKRDAFNTKIKTYYTEAENLKASINSTIYAIGNGAKTALENDSGKNKWVHKRYGVVIPVNTIPSYGHIQGLPHNYLSLVGDSATLVSNVGDNYTGLLKTALYVSTAKSITFTFTHDEGAQIYVNGISAYSKDSSATGASATLSLNMGWNTIEILYAERTGSDGIWGISPVINTLVDKMSCYFAGDMGQILNAEQAANQAQQAANNVQNNLTNLVIGGRNWVLGTGTAATQTGNAGTNQTKTIYSFVGNSSSGLLDKDITISFDWSVTLPAGVSTTSGTFYLQGSNPYYSLSNTINLADGLSGRMIKTTKITGSACTGVNLRCDNVPTNTTLTIKNLKIEFGSKATDWTPALEDTQAYIDGKAETWFYSGAPTLSNAPASNWPDSATRSIHVDDLYFDTGTKQVYRFKVDTGVYSWESMQDTDIQTALANASQAQETADSKMQVFIATPKPPYDIGDLWVEGSSGDIKKCKTARAQGDTYDVNTDFELASKYTDDTAVKNLNIGGRNILRQSAPGATTTLSAHTGSNCTSTLTIVDDTAGPKGKAINIVKTNTVGVASASGGRYFTVPYKLTSGVNYSWSLYAKGTGTITSLGQEQDGQKSVTLTSTYQKITHTFTANTASYYQFTFYGTGDFSVTAHSLKLEQSDKPSDWSPAPEDVEDAINTKKRVFTVVPPSIPPVPYEVGDLWSQGAGGDLMRCKTPRYTPGTALLSDWETASKYTDDSTANRAMNNLLRMDVWKAGTPDSSVTPYFTPNGGTNTIVYGTNPYGFTDLIWEAKDNDATDAGGGFITADVTINPKKTYRYVGWVRRTSDTYAGNVYLGCKASSVANSLGAVQTNPYFFSQSVAATLPVKNDWYLYVAYIYPHDYTWSLHASRLYDKNGTEVLTGTDFKWASASITAANLRFFQYYASENTTTLQYYMPRIEVVDGTEQKIDSLFLGVATKANNSVQLGEDYNDLIVDPTTGITVTSTNNYLNLSASNGLKITNTKSSKDVFTLNSATGDLTVTGNLNMTGGSIRWAMENETAIKGMFWVNGSELQLNADKITTGLMSAARLDVKGKLTVNNGTKDTFAIDSSGNVKLDGNITMSSGSINWTNVTSPSVQQVKVDSYINSRKGNLISNGTASLLNNTNFTSFTFDPDNYPAGGFGSFKYTGKSATKLSDEFIPIDPEELYILKIAVKSDVANQKIYAGLAPYDLDNYLISYSYYCHYPETTVTLASDLKPGDTVVYLSSTTNWKTTTTNTSQRRLLFWGYSDSHGYTYPDNTYTKNITTSDLWADGSINTTANTITLRAAFAGTTTYPAGTKVSQGAAGSSYLYCLANNYTVPTDWTLLTGTITGTSTDGSNSNPYQFPPGTAKVKMVFLPNNGNTTTDETLWITNIEMYDTFKQSDFTGENIASQIVASENALEIISQNINLTGQVNFNTFTTWALDENQNKISNGATPPLYLDTQGKWRPLSDEQYFVSDIFTSEGGRTVIDGGKILTNSIEARHANFYDLVIELRKPNGFEPDGVTTHYEKTNIETFTVDNVGNVTLMGTASSSNYLEKQTGWIIKQDGMAEFNGATFRGNIEAGYYDTTKGAYIATAGINVSEATSEDREVRFWAGSDSKNAPFKVYSNGDLEATQGQFEGTFSGKVTVGNIVIEDSDIAGDASFTLADQNNIELITLNELEAIFGVSHISFGSDDFVDIFPDIGLVTLESSNGNLWNFDVKYNNLKMQDFIFNGQSDGLYFNSYLTEADYDFHFTKDDGDVSVRVAGDLTVGTLRMRQSTDVGNTGIDFVF